MTRSKAENLGRKSVEKYPIAKKVSFDPDTMWVDLADGRMLGVPLAYFPRLLNAKVKQRKNYVISGGGTGLHWEEIDEDICVRALMQGIGDQTSAKLV